MKPAHEVIADLHSRYGFERAAWVRLVLAERAWHDQTVALDGERDRDMKGAYAEVCAAREALRAMGVESPACSEEP